MLFLLQALTQSLVYFVFQAPGVWYKVLGTGSTMRASTCNAATSLDTVISVFASCDSVSCFDSNDQFCGNQSEIEWDTEEGQEYFILVHGWSTDEIGPFELSLTEIVPPTNDICSDATSIEIGESLTGSTEIATVEDSIFDGCPFDVRGKYGWSDTFVSFAP